MNTPHKLLLIYFSALAVLLASVVVTMIVTEMTAQQLENDAGTINMSGRQRMLSQRISYLAEDAFLDQLRTPDSSPRDTIAQLREALDLFTTSHDHLTAITEHADLYSATRHGASLDTRVRNFIAAASAVADDPSREDSLERLKQVESDGLLSDLDHVVSSIEAASVDRISFLLLVGRLSILFALIIILVEVLLVFLPGHRMIENAIRDLTDRNAELDRTREDIHAKNRAFERSITKIGAERDHFQKVLLESKALRSEHIALTKTLSFDLKSKTEDVRLALKALPMQAEAEDDTIREAIERAQHSLQWMTDQIQEALAYASSTDQKELPESVDLNDVVRDVRRRLQHRIAASNARITVGELDHLPGYRDQVFTLLMNLANNALIYHAPGTRPEVEIASRPLPDSDGICLRITDNGIGIAPEDHAKIFSPFQRLHPQSEYPGAGLGLNTCLHVARNHHGSIVVTSELGRGATFTVTLRDPNAPDAVIDTAA